MVHSYSCGELEFRGIGYEVRFGDYCQSPEKNDDSSESRDDSGTDLIRSYQVKSAELHFGGMPVFPRRSQNTTQFFGTGD